jgi:hypothetical protein
MLVYVSKLSRYYACACTQKTQGFMRTFMAATAGMIGFITLQQSAPSQMTWAATANAELDCAHLGKR